MLLYETVQWMAQEVSMDLNLLWVNGPFYSGQSLETFLKNIPMKDQDVLWIYLRGTDFPSSQQWPILAFADGSSWELPGLFQLAREKGAALTVVLAETDHKPNDLEDSIDSLRFDSLEDRGVLTQLLAKSRGSLLLALPPSFDQKNGAYSPYSLTHDFLTQLYSEVAQGSGQWAQLFSRLGKEGISSIQPRLSLYTDLVEPKIGSLPRSRNMGPRPTPREGYFTNRGVNSWIFKTEFEFFFQYEKEKWIRIPRIQGDPIILLEEVGEESGHLLLESAARGYFSIPMEKESKGEARRFEKESWVFWSEGEWFQGIMNQKS